MLISHNRITFIVGISMDLKHPSRCPHGRRSQIDIDEASGEKPSSRLLPEEEEVAQGGLHGTAPVETRGRALERSACLRGAGSRQRSEVAGARRHECAVLHGEGGAASGGGRSPTETER